MNKTIYLGVSVLEISKIVMYEFYYDYLKPKNGEKNMLHGYRQLYSLHKNRRYLSKHAKDVERRFNSSN